MIGRMAIPAAELDVHSVFWEQLDVLGSSMGSPRDFAALLDHLTAHAWRPSVDSVFPLAQIADATNASTPPTG